MSSAAYLTLQDHKVFGSLHKESVETLSYGAIITRVAKGQMIYELGQEMKYLYVLDKGIAKLSSDQVEEKTLIKDIMYKGDFFGENIFYNSTKRLEDAIAIKDCTLIKIQIDKYKKAITQDTDFASIILQTITSRSARIDERMRLFTHGDARSRVIHFFKDFIDKIGIWTPEGIRINHGLSNNEIGALTDTSRQSVSKVMADLKNKGLIHFEERHPDDLLIKGDIE